MINKLMLVSSPHAFSTRDVYIGHLAGLRELMGEKNVISYDIIPRYNIFTHFTYMLEKEVGYVPPEFAANMLAAEPVFGAAHWHDVDAVYFISPMYFPLTIVQLLRKAGKKCYAYFTECPYEDELWTRSQATFFDACFVNDLHSLTRFRTFNENTYYIPHAYNPNVHYPARDKPRSKSAPVIYVGTGFKRRRELLEAVDWSDIDFRLYGLWVDDLDPKLHEADMRETGILEGSPLLQFARHARPTPNRRVAGIYRTSSIGISMHRVERDWNEYSGCIDPGEAYSLGPRSYEMAACGLFQISDDRPELRDVFGNSVPVFHNPEELGRLIRYYLDHPDEREEMRQEQLAAVQPHNTKNRMAQFLEAVA